MRKLYMLLGVVSALLLSSCNDWLDVRPDTEQKAEQQFSSYKGFRDALIGCYMSMGNKDIYGEKLTISHSESLANLWLTSDRATGDRLVDYYLSRHDYTQSSVRTAMQNTYSALFNVIVQANMIIKHAERNAEAFPNEATRSVILGEAYAIRAYCQADVLRLFGQLPKNATEQVRLPYSYTTAFDEKPTYCDFDEYVEKLEADMKKAEDLLKDNDPVFEHTFTELNTPASNLLEDSYMYYRQSRMNYWAVKALQARMYLYLGQSGKAHDAAMAIIDAKDEDGNPVITLSSRADFSANRMACPSECLFYLSKYDIDEVASMLVGNDELSRDLSADELYVSSEQVEKLFEDQSSSHNHNLRSKMWNTTHRDPSGSKVTLCKYWFEDSEENKLTGFQLVPMLRMSEVYLIAIETATDLNVANRLYTAYMLDRNVQWQGAFRDLNELPELMLNEYRREFYGEGQIFYTYKRRFVKDMLWNDEEMTEKDYVLWECFNDGFNA